MNKQEDNLADTSSIQVDDDSNEKAIEYEIREEPEFCTTSKEDTTSCELIDVLPSELLSFSDTSNVVTFPDGSQWSYITINPDAASGSGIETVIPIEEEKADGLSGSTITEGQILILDDGRIAYIKQKDSCNVIELGSNCQTIFAVAETVTDSKILKKKTKSHYCVEPGCDRSYTSLHHLKVHVRNHTGDRPYPCSIDGCNKAFATDYSRKAHLRTHTGEKPYPCPESSCSKSFKTSGDLQKHIRTHTGERPFMCPVDGCFRSFTTSNIRKVHIRTHTGERPYMCNYPGCERSFASSTNYKNHMRIHSGEKPYICTVPFCHKKFTEYSSLYKHQLVHSQHKRYQCPFCNKTYRQVSTLSTHKKTVHGVISADDGTEIVLEQVIGIGEDGNKNFKNITSNLLNLKRDGSALITIEDNDTSLFIVPQDNEEVDTLEFGDEDSVPL